MTVTLSQNSAYSYFNKVRAALRQAFEERYIVENPANRVRGVKAGESDRQFVDKEEIKKLIITRCDSGALKKAFLFSVLTGLRWSDMISLTWAEVQGNSKDGWYLNFQMRKTKSFEKLPVTAQAIEIIGSPGNPTEKVFRGLKYSANTNLLLEKWVQRAGINKKITFHCARHSYATLLLTSGVDIYVVSKMLGHKNIKTTELYAKVVNSKKVEAVQKIPMFDLGHL